MAEEGESEKLNNQESQETETDLRTWHLNNQDIPSSSYSKRKQVLATSCVTLGCLLNGAVIGYTSPAIPSMINNSTGNVWGSSTPVSFQQTSWVTGILSIGCFVGCVIAGPIMERIGRKKSLMLVAGGFYALGFILISLASHAEFIYAGR